MLCPKCKGLMYPKDDLLECKKCGFKKKKEGKNVIVNKQEQKEVTVIDQKHDTNVLPKTNIRCPKCDNNEAYFLLNRAKDIAEELQDDILLKEVYFHLGEIYYIEAGYMAKRNFDSALEYHNKALELREKVGDKDGIVDSFARIGTIYERQGQRDEALDYQKKGFTVEGILCCGSSKNVNYSSIGRGESSPSPVWSESRVTSPQNKL